MKDTYHYFATMNGSILSAFGIYIISMLLVGVMASRLTKNLDDYILGGRSLSPFVSALSAGASDMSGWLMMGLPGLIYLHGANQIWLPIGLLIGAYLNWRLIAKRLRIYTQALGETLTLPVYLKRRFEDSNDVLLRLSGLLILFFFVIYTAAGFYASAILFQSMFHLSYENALLLGFFSVVSYVLVGGFIGVCWTDTIQGIIIFLSLVTLPVVAYVVMHHNHHNVWQLISSVRPSSYFDALHNQGFLSIFSLMGWGLGYFGQPHILVRFMAIRSPEKLYVARRIGMTWMLFSLLGAILVGMLAVGYFAHNPLNNHESSFIELSRVLFPDFLAGVFLAAVLSAIMSSASSQLILLASVAAEDFYHPFRGGKASQKELLWVGRFSVALLASVSFLLATRKDSTVLSIVAYAWAGLGSTFGPVVLFSLFWKKMTRQSAIAAMLVGGITVIVWENVEAVRSLLNVYSIIPGFFLGCVTIVLLSWLDKKGPSLNMVKIFESVQLENKRLG